MSQNQRKSNYHDHKLQGILLSALVIMETLLLIIAIFYLYQRFNAIIDENLFKIHKVNSEDLIQAMFSELFRVIAYLLMANIAALIIAHFIWGKFVSNVLTIFRKRLELLADLNFSTVKNKGDISHEVIAFTERWQQLEHKRCLKIRAITQDLNKLNHDSQEQKQALIEQLMKLKSLLNAEPIEFE